MGRQDRLAAVVAATSSQNIRQRLKMSSARHDDLIASFIDGWEVIEIVEPLEAAQSSVDEGVPCVVVEVADCKTIGKCLAAVSKAVGAAGNPMLLKPIEHLKQVHKSGTKSEILVAPSAAFPEGRLRAWFPSEEAEKPFKPRNKDCWQFNDAQALSLYETLLGLVQSKDAVRVALRTLPSWSRAFELHLGDASSLLRGTLSGGAAVVDDWPVDAARMKQAVAQPFSSEPSLPRVTLLELRTGRKSLRASCLPKADAHYLAAMVKQTKELAGSVAGAQSAACCLISSRPPAAVSEVLCPPVVLRGFGADLSFASKLPKSEAAFPLAVPAFCSATMLALQSIADGDLHARTDADEHQGHGGGSSDAEFSGPPPKRRKMDLEDKSHLATTSSPDSYLATGCDAFLSRVPDFLSAMTLLHSRIGRLFFLEDEGSSEPRGEEGPTLKNIASRLHTMPGLNHHFQVFSLQPANGGNASPVARAADQAPLAR